MWVGWSNCTRCIVNSHLMFQSHFDCVVTPMMFSAQDLAWMVAMWSGTTTHPGTFMKILYYKDDVQWLFYFICVFFFVSCISWEVDSYRTVALMVFFSSSFGWLKNYKSCPFKNLPFSKRALIFQQKFKLMSEFAQNNPVEICIKTQT